MHLGLIVVRIKGLTRPGLGTKVLITLLDKRWTDVKKALIATIEVDMTTNRGLFYCSPDYQITISDLNQIEVGIQTKGYEQFTGENFMINIGFLGRTTTGSNTKYKINVESIIEAMHSSGIKLLKPIAIDPTILAREEWNLSKLVEKKLL